MSVRYLRAPAVLVCLLALACNPLTSADHDVIVRWLECEDCTTGQLDTVVAIGEPAVPTLRGYLWNGPPALRFDQLMAHLGESYSLVAAYHRSLDTTSGTVSDSALYTRRYLNNYVANYQSRSAKALGLIGGDSARIALDSALQLSLRSDVHYQVQYAIDSLWTP